LGLIGHNGAGKTTLLKILNGLIKPDTGFITMRGRVGALIALGAGFNPILTGRENVYINGSILGLSKKEIDEQIDSIIDFAEIREFIDAPVQSYSSGMQVRLGFAVATATQPDVLILDEVLAVGDAAFRTKCFVRISSLLSQAAVIFVSHTEQEISRICTSVLMLQRGKVACSGDLTKCLDFYRQSQPTESAKQNVYHHDAVKKADLLLSAVEHKSGEDLALELHYVTEAAFKLSTHILAMADETGSPVAVCNLLPLFDELKNGENRLKFSIKALSLRPGNYSFGLEVLSDKHSEVLVRKRLSHSIKSSGQIYYWCAYTPSAYKSV
jgi:lipopolysaccharide transport system ATP-binding protein